MICCISPLGAGGGYNERENVEYKEREESDDEYDEVNSLSLPLPFFTSFLTLCLQFGRKKKKFRRKGHQNGGKPNTTTITYEVCTNIMDSLISS